MVSDETVNLLNLLTKDSVYSGWDVEKDSKYDLCCILEGGGGLSRASFSASEEEVRDWLRGLLYLKRESLRRTLKSIDEVLGG